MTGATEATLYLSAATNYVNYHDVSGDAAVRADRCLQRAVQIPYKKLWKPCGLLPKVIRAGAVGLG